MQDEIQKKADKVAAVLVGAWFKRGGRPLLERAFLRLATVEGVKGVIDEVRASLLRHDAAYGPLLTDELMEEVAEVLKVKLKSWLVSR